MGITINITEGINDYEFYDVPKKVAKAIITLLHECEKDDSTIVSAISGRQKMGMTIEQCENCTKDWTKCGTCPVMMQWIKEHKHE